MFRWFDYAIFFAFLCGEIQTAKAAEGREEVFEISSLLLMISAASSLNEMHSSIPTVSSYKFDIFWIVQCFKNSTSSPS